MKNRCFYPIITFKREETFLPSPSDTPGKYTNVVDSGGSGQTLAEKIPIIFYRFYHRHSYVCVLSCFSYVRLCATPWTVARQAPLYMEFSRQEYWSGLPFPPPGDLPNPGTEPVSLLSPALATYHSYHHILCTSIISSCLNQISASFVSFMSKSE